jgi:hypothetical protein
MVKMVNHEKTLEQIYEVKRLLNRHRMGINFMNIECKLVTG